MRVWDCHCHLKGTETGQYVLDQMNAAGVERINLFSAYPGRGLAPNETATQAEVRRVIGHALRRLRRQVRSVVGELRRIGPLRGCRCADGNQRTERRCDRNGEGDGHGWASCGETGSAVSQRRTLPQQA